MAQHNLGTVDIIVPKNPNKFVWLGTELIDAVIDACVAFGQITGIWGKLRSIKPFV